MKTPRPPASTPLRSDGNPIVVDLPATDEHALAEAGVLGGALAGGMLGAIAGPIGILAGVALGSAAGALAGDAIDRDTLEGNAHDKELDDTIGVTSGSLGTPPETKHPSAEALADARQADIDRAERG